MTSDSKFAPIMEREDVMVHPSFTGERVRFSTYISNYYDLGEDSEEHQLSVIERWHGIQEVGFSMNFWLSDALDAMIDLYESPMDGSFGADDKPMFNSLRAELVRMIERIDALTFRLPD